MSLNFLVLFLVTAISGGISLFYPSSFTIILFLALTLVTIITDILLFATGIALKRTLLNHSRLHLSKIQVLLITLFADKTMRGVINELSIQR